MKGFKKFVEGANLLLKYIVSVMFIALAVLVFFQVITRFVIDYPLAWSEEISKYLMIYIVFFGSALAVKDRQHIAIDFLTEIVSPANKRKLNGLILIICSIFFVILTYFGFVLTFTVLDQATPTLRFSIAWAYAAIPVGSLFMLLNAIYSFIAAPLEEDGEEITNMKGEAK